MALDESGIQRLMLTCVHFNGLQCGTCNAGKAYAEFRDVSQPGMARWPCVTLMGRRTATTVCPDRVRRTREQAEAEEAKIEAAMDAFDNALDGGLCPACLQRIENRHQVGRCVYAKPCGHRLGEAK